MDSRDHARTADSSHFMGMSQASEASQQLNDLSTSILQSTSMPQTATPHEKLSGSQAFDSLTAAEANLSGTAGRLASQNISRQPRTIKPFGSCSPQQDLHSSERQETKLSDFRMPPARYRSSPGRSPQPLISGAGFAASPNRASASHARAGLFKPSNPQALCTEPDMRSRESLQLRRMQASPEVHSWSGPLTEKQLGGGSDDKASQMSSRAQHQASSTRQDRSVIAILVCISFLGKACGLWKSALKTEVALS